MVAPNKCLKCYNTTFYLTGIKEGDEHFECSKCGTIRICRKANRNRKEERGAPRFDPINHNREHHSHYGK